MKAVKQPRREELCAYRDSAVLVYETSSTVIVLRQTFNGSHLTDAQRHVEEGRALIRRQRQILAQLERDDQGAQDARQLLRNMVEAQKLHENELVLIQAKLRLSRPAK